MQQVVHHYPPEVVELLAEVVPKLFKSKPAVIDFFMGACSGSLLTPMRPNGESP